MHETKRHCFEYTKTKKLAQCTAKTILSNFHYKPLALSVAAVIHVIEKSVGGEVGWKGRKRGRK